MPETNHSPAETSAEPMGSTYVTLRLEGTEAEAKGIIDAIHKTGQAQVVSRTFTQAPTVEEPLTAQQARELGDEDGYVSVLVEADLSEMLERHQYGESGGDDEMDYLHSLGFSEGTPHDCSWTVLATDECTATVLYTTSLEGFRD